ncbi:MAG: orotidine-5'-phosphate decarboxylase [Alphaproteobacteria bacterium]
MQKKIFLAVDTDDINYGIKIVKPLQDGLAGIKLGLEFFVANGIKGVMMMKENFPSLPLFLDLKFHDIPNTTKQAVKALLALEPFFLTIHAAGGVAMIEFVKKTMMAHQAKTKLLAVTMLTSLSDDDLKILSIKKNTNDYILSQAMMARDAGADGVVIPAKATAMLRNNMGEDFILVCPGIRWNDDGSDDQKQVMPPKSAIDAGADYLVMGRGIIGTHLTPSEQLARLAYINKHTL